ncbi:MAG: AAA family ATPase [Luteitalea sp.]|nr:AAA family ATPase [Luteitalea sp.]
MPQRQSHQLTDAQDRERIRTSLDETMAVEAAAGTGKTTVLVERIVNVIASGRADVDCVVAVTFTEKAAGELKLRLRTCLEQARPRGHQPTGPLDQALARLEQAHVSTIHGFCADLLRERPVEAGVDPQFRTLTESEAERLFRETVRQWLPQALENPPEGVRRALRRRSFDEEGPITRLERAAWTLAEWRDFPAPWRQDPFDRETDIDRLLVSLDAFVVLTREPADPADPFFSSIQAAHRLARDIVLAERVHPRDYDGIEGRLVDLGRSGDFRRPRTGRRAAPYRRGLARADVLSAHETLLSDLVTFGRAADAQLAAHLQAELQEPLARYRAAKMRLGVLDFLDLLLCARDLVRDHDHVRRDFQQRFTHIFVDEFQDTDPLQAELLLLISANDADERDWRAVVPAAGKLFIVGDPKQSIYRFRRADVGVYHDVREQLRRAGAACPVLTTNFRSLPRLQRFVNAAFEPWMRADAVTLQAAYVPLSPSRADESAQPAVVVLPVPDPYGGRDGRTITERAIEASLPQAVGAFVAWLVDDSGWTITERDEPGRQVPVAARHVCLLFRRFDVRRFDGGLEDITRPYVEALESRGVPHLLVGGKSFHDREEIETVRTALTALEWPDDELSVYGTLRGTLFGVRDELLFEYRRIARRLHPFTRPTDPVPEHLTPIVAALDLLRDLHARRNSRPVAETLARLLDATRAHVALALRPAGEQALANVHHVVELARQYEADGGFSFRGFVETLHDEAERSRATEAPILEAGSDGVRLMTTHRAKGLEFPVVVLVDPSCRLSRTFASRWVDRHTRRAAVSLTGWAPVELREHEQEEAVREEAEAVRVAYVAATRARDLLVVPAIGDGPRDGGWLSPLNAAIYPDEDRRREAVAAPECPRFGPDSVRTRTIGTTPMWNVRPGRHSYGGETGTTGSRDAHPGYDVVWWDPSVLELERPPAPGLRREELIARDAPEHIVTEALREYETWRQSKQHVLEIASAPSTRVLTVRARAAQLFDGGAEGGPAPDVTIDQVNGTSGEARPRGARFGALVHAALGLVPLDADDARVGEIVDQQMRVLGASSEERPVAVALVASTLRHPVFARAREAAARGRVRRETPVALVGDDGVLLEGVVDLAYEAEEGWVVVDFKTDQELDGPLDQYRRQVGLYAEAIARATGRPARGVILRL